MLEVEPLRGKLLERGLGTIVPLPLLLHISTMLVLPHLLAVCVKAMLSGVHRLHPDEVFAAAAAHAAATTGLDPLLAGSSDVDVLAATLGVADAATRAAAALGAADGAHAGGVDPRDRLGLGFNARDPREFLGPEVWLTV